MGSWWRSEEMVYISLIMTEESAISCIRELGSLGCIQFVDLNPELTAFQREYVSNIKRCDEIEKRIRYVYGETKRLNIDVNNNVSIDDFLSNARREQTNNTNTNGGNGNDVNQGSGAYILENLEKKLDKFDKQLINLVDYNKQLSEQYTKKVEYHHLLIQAHKIIRAVSEIELKSTGNNSHSSSSSSSSSSSNNNNSSNYERTIEDGDVVNPLISLTDGDNTGATSSYQDTADGGGSVGGGLAMSFSNISGVIATSDRVRFERMLFRSTRGNCYIRFAPLSSSSTASSANANPAMDADGNVIEKLCFVIFYKSNAIEKKIIKICDAFNTTRYDLSMLNSSHEIQLIQRTNYQELLDSKSILDKNTNMRYDLCLNASNSIEEWLWIIKREKSIYYTLNLFKTDVAGRLIRARGWMMEKSISDAKSALHRAHLLLNLPNNALIERVGGSWPKPPTYYITNKYTYAFQEFVNTYGIPRYREINPALFTAATFPFLFGVMYGDIGHGSILALAAIYLILTADKIKNDRTINEILKNIYSARYMILGMGICSVYAGLIYNDFFSLGLNLFGTRYQFGKGHDGTGKNEDELVKGDIGILSNNLKYGDNDSVYPFGVDPIWHVSTNNLPFFNSMKMKMSVILGISQMTIGIVLRGINSYYTGGYGLDFYAEFVPMIIFDIGLFGYMILLIFTKWSINWNDRMALGSCEYDKNGKFGACHLSDSSYCYSFNGNKCNKDTQVVDLCPLDYGGSGDGCQPPNLITTLINIVLKPGTVEEPMFSGQAGLQTFLLFISFLCIPWILCVKPYFIKKAHNEQHGHGSSHGTTHGHGHGSAGASTSLMADMSEHDSGYDHIDDVSNPIQEFLGGDSSIEMSNLNLSSGTGAYFDYDEFDRNRSDSLESITGFNYDSSNSNSNSYSNSNSNGAGSNADFLPGGGGYDIAAAASGHGDGDDDEFNFGEICVHQAIETIEFALGMVSNTASYLRLWALSLAHTQLAEVFWEKVMLPAIESGNPVMIFIAFFIFAQCTTGVLLFMDALECFLHALRLHWVEFQNKFYKADGTRFYPFDFNVILAEANLE
jgi:V-type H+-transporting ATPase subunit a